jgi:hypothetical protein
LAVIHSKEINTRDFKDGLHSIRKSLRAATPYFSCSYGFLSSVINNSRLDYSDELHNEILDFIADPLGFVAKHEDRAIKNRLDSGFSNYAQAS